MEKINICPAAEVCGGCSYQGVSYDEQLKIKENEVRDLLVNAGIDPSLLSGIIPSPVRYGYRNKMEYTFGDQVKGGELHLGLHEKGHFMNIVDVSSCMLVHDDFNVIVKATLDFVIDKGYTHYNKKTHKGFCRSLVLRRGIRTNETVVNIVTTTENEFDEEGYRDLILSLDLNNSVAGILHTLNDSFADTVKCESMNVIYGREYYVEEIMGLKFKIGPFSFFQTNVEAAERLYSDAISLIDSFEDKTVFDLFCGTGTITQAMAKNAKKAIGVEIVEEAVETAKESAMTNGLDNCTFIAGDVGKVLSEISDTPDVIVVDPPRSGITPKAMKMILDYGVRQIVYISCNPKTMVVNLRSAIDNGYEVKKITAYDNFPMTRHVETVVLMTRTERKKS